MRELDPETIAGAKKAVCEAFPEMDGVEPDVYPRRIHGKGVASLHVLTFHKSISLPDGGRLARVVRVTLDESGEIVRVSCSK